MTTATSPVRSGGGSDIVLPDSMLAAFGARVGGLSGIDLDGHRHALAKRSICVGDDNPQTIDQIRAQISGLDRFWREFGARRNEPDLALIGLVGRVAAKANTHSGRDEDPIRFADIRGHTIRNIKAERTKEHKSEQ